jgi:hypothetical protein
MANGLRNNSIPPYRKSCASSAQDFFIFPINSEEFLREFLRELKGVKELKELRQ